MISRLLTLLDAFPARRVAVIGDLIADEFIYGRVARVSREAPVLICNTNRRRFSPEAPAMRDWCGARRPQQIVGPGERRGG